ncbi:Acylphosphatase [uncultured archaeon]|nr:Acylphosphatase [uncultured archaeon]
MQKTFLVNFFGRVQGIGFRSLLMSEANKRALFGWVKNSPRRDLVEACFFGEEKKVFELIEYLKTNPGMIRVDNVVVEETGNFEDFADFRVKY